MITLKIIGKQDCVPCNSAKKKWNLYLEKWNMKEKVDFMFLDVDTDEGKAEAEFYEVDDVPFTTIEYDDEPIKSWKDKIVEKSEVRKVLDNLLCQEKN